MKKLLLLTTLTALTTSILSAGTLSDDDVKTQVQKELSPGDKVERTAKNENGSYRVAVRSAKGGIYSYFVNQDGTVVEAFTR